MVTPKTMNKPENASIPLWKPAVAIVALLAVVAVAWGLTLRKPATPLSLKLVMKNGETLFTENGAIWEFADVGTQINYGGSLKTGDKAKAILQAPDGTFIRLTGNTELKANSVSKDGILLTQNSGKTFHRVKSIETGPYQVKALGNTLKATGTAFEISVNAAEQRINAKVFEGELKITLPDDATTLTLGKGREITLNAKSNATTPASDISPDYTTGDWFLWNKAEDLKLGYDLRLPPSVAPTEESPIVESVTATDGTKISATTKPTPPKTGATPTKTVTKTTPTVGDCKPSLSLKRGLGGMGIQLNWTTCKNDDFQFYKVIRSTTNPALSYPSTPALVSSNNRFFGAYLDKNLAIGTTYYYRVCVVERLNQVGCGNVAKMAN
jgi:hypothetical protein